MQGPRTPPSGSAGEPAEPALTLSVPEQLLDALAERVACRIAALLEQPEPASPWLDFEAAREYLRFSRDQLYKLTAAKAIPFRKRRGGQGLLFHRDEFDRWLETAYEPTGCAGEVELWSSTDT
jgi:excisionase family DNA binding protein